jgi:predicted metalloprotease with PDZ domain
MRGNATSSLGLRVRGDGGRTMVTQVIRDASGQRAGIDPGDELVAIGGKRIDGASLDPALYGRKPGEPVDVLVARDGRMLTCTAIQDEPRFDRLRLVHRPDATDEERARFADWIGDTQEGDRR